MPKISAYLTPEMLLAAFRVATIATEYARSLGRASGMTDAEIDALEAESKLDNANNFGDYVAAIGGVWPPVAVPPEPEPPALRWPYYDPRRQETTTWPDLPALRRNQFLAGDSIYSAQITGGLRFFVLAAADLNGPQSVAMDRLLKGIGAQFVAYI